MSVARTITRYCAVEHRYIMAACVHVRVVLIEEVCRDCPCRRLGCLTWLGPHQYHHDAVLARAGYMSGVHYLISGYHCVVCQLQMHAVTRTCLARARKRLARVTSLCASASISVTVDTHWRDRSLSSSRSKADQLIEQKATQISVWLCCIRRT